jgi:Protein of unknown function (DUF1566)
MVFVEHLMLENEHTMNWDNKINDPTRFRVLAAFNNEAVLDRETGLVWERSPSIQPMAWPNARLFCAQKAVGGRGGWRLPAFFELASLVEPSVHAAGVPRLPSGHPFMNVQAADYWSDTAFADEPGFVLMVGFHFVAGSDAPIFVTDANIGGAPKYAWAVRGGSAGMSSY